MIFKHLGHLAGGCGLSKRRHSNILKINEKKKMEKCALIWLY